MSVRWRVGAAALVLGLAAVAAAGGRTAPLSLVYTAGVRGEIEPCG